MVLSDDLLHVIYQFPHLQPPQDQNVGTIETLLNHLLTSMREGVIRAEQDEDEEEEESAALMREQELQSFEVLLQNLVMKPLEEPPRMDDGCGGMDVKGSCGVISWYPTYGCALVYRYVDFNTSLSPSLVILDGWQLIPAKQSEVCSASTESFSTVDFWTIPSARGKDFMERLRLFMSPASKEKGHQWTPAFVQACVERVFQDSAETSEPVKPRGGTTDVGQHTGSARRSTAWALIVAVLGEFYGEQMTKRFLMQVHLAELRALIDRTEGGLTQSSASMMMHMLKKAVDGLVDLAKEFRCSVKGAEKVLGELRVSVDGLLAAYRARQLQASQIDLRSSSIGDELKPHAFSCCESYEASQTELPKSSLSVSEMEQKAWKTMSGVRLPDSEHFSSTEQKLETSLSLGELLQWLGSIEVNKTSCSESQRGYAFQLVSSYFCEVVTSSDALGVLEGKAGVSPKGWIKDGKDLETLEKLMRIYDDMSYMLLETQGNTNGEEGDNSLHMTYARTRSTNMLVYWIATCLAHAFVSEQCPLLKGYDVPISPSNLSLLVMDDATTRKAVSVVFRYLRRYRKLGWPVFHLEFPQNTMEFARQVVKASKPMMLAWSATRSAASAREQRHWEDVLEHKSDLQEMRNNRAELGREKHELEEHIAKIYDDSEYSSRTKKHLTSHLRMKLNNVSQSVENMNRRITYQLSNVPPTVMHPLPSVEFLAFPIIYYVFQPRTHAILEAMFYNAAEKCCGCMIPSPGALQSLRKRRADSKYEIPSYEKSTLSRYNNHTTLAKVLGTSFMPYYKHDLSIKSSGITLDKISKANHMNLCVSYPDVEISIYHSSAHNPFDAKPSDCSRFFCQQVDPKAMHSLQWAVNYPVRTLGGEGEDRGNLSLFRRTPPNFDKRGFLALGNLRSYPMQQLRKIAVAIREMGMDFNDRIVHIVFLQALYQVGELQEAESSLWCFVWEQDLHQHGLLSLLLGELRSKLDLVSEGKTKNFLALYLFFEVAYFLERTLDCGETCGMGDESSVLVHVLYHRATLKWATDAQEAFANSPHDGKLLLEEALYSALALLTMVRLPLDVKQASALLCMYARAQYSLGQVFVTPETTGLQAIASQFVARAKDLLCPRMPELLILCQKHADKILTPAVQCVYTDAPRSLEWKNYGMEYDKASTCFGAATTEAPKTEGQPEDVRIYAINILNGLVTLNGSTPIRLPPEVHGDKLYLQSFRTVGNMVVSSIRGGSALKTLSPLNGCFYDIQLSPDGKNSPRIFEYPAERSNSEDDNLELVDPLDVSRWTCMLPERITKSNSCWYGKSAQVLLVRPREFRERRVLYLVDLEHTCRTYRVPKDVGVCTTWSTTLAELAEQARCSWEALYVVPTAIASVLRRFEAFTYMEIWARAHPASDREDTDDMPVVEGKRMEVRLELPRFRLYFRIRHSKNDGGDLVSLNYKGYVLSRTQFVDAMPSFFQQYLVLGSMAKKDTGDAECQKNLQRQHSVLIPTLSGGFFVAGSKQSSHGRCIGVDIEGTCDASLSCHFYELHPRLGILKGRDFASRLMLATVYASKSSAIPEPALGMTGTEMAIALVEQSFTNVILNDRSERALRELGQYARFEPALALACDHLYRSASESSFLSAAYRSGTGESTTVSSEPTRKCHEHESVSREDNLAPSSLRTLEDAISRHERRLRSNSYRKFLRHRTTAWEELERDNASRALRSIDLILPSPSLQMPEEVDEKYEELMKLLEGDSERRRQSKEMVNRSENGEADAKLARIGEDRNGLKLEEEEQGIEKMSEDDERPFKAEEYIENDEHEFPLKVGTAQRSLVREMTEDLEKSWKSFHRDSEKGLMPDSERENGRVGDMLREEDAEKLWLDKTRVRRLLDDVTAASSELLGMLLGVLNTSSARHSEVWRALQHANQAPKANAVDLMRIAVEGDEVGASSSALSFNPFLLPETCLELRRYTRLLMAAWVEQDRMQRLLAQKTADDFARELETQRIWSVDKHPRWLAFEVEQQIKIRPVQYQVAAHMLNNPGTICQLNMGMGKTRIILPMLILEWTRTQYRECPRIHVMKQLLSDTVIYLQDVLSGSAIHSVPMFQQPFHRQVDLTTARCMRLQITWKRMMRRGGYQVVAPEHSMSLYLSWNERRLASPTSPEVVSHGALLKQIETTSINIFDESDELLSQRYQIVYATGSPQTLGEMSVRSSVLYSLLRILARSRDYHPHLERLLSNKNFALRPDFVDMEKVPTRHIAGALLVPIELLPLEASEDPSDPLKDGAGQDLRGELREAIFDALLEKGCRMEWLRWLREKDEEIFEQVRAMALDVSVSVPKVIMGLDMSSGRREELLALRGYLGCQLLEICLEKPYRVGYGLAPQRSRLAVPFVAADVPSLRSDFNHPDIRMVLTTLSYLYQGLNRKQIMEALQKLLTLEPSSRRYEYERWVAPLRDRVPGISSVDSDEKLELRDLAQREFLYQIFRFSLEVIFFWLETMVFPVEMIQYPKNIKHSAWHLPLNHRAVGFSGTKDNAKLLPMCHGLQQRDLEVLGMTDGLMLFRIMMHSSVWSLVQVQQPHQDPQPLWKQVVSTSLRMKNVTAIIDAGSLLVGVRNAVVARCILDSDAFDRERFRGVFYFETGEAHDGGHWVFLDAVSGLIEPRSTASAKDDEGFIIFDDARCRGSDFKLAKDSCATLTLGKKLTKTKLMQSALRMRQLGRNQSIILLCPGHVERLIRRSMYSTAGGGGGGGGGGGSGEDGGCEGGDGAQNMDAAVMVIDVLRWVMQNTIQEIEVGLMDWSAHGVFFNESQQNLERVQTEEVWSLEHCYSKEMKYIPLNRIAAQIVERSNSHQRLDSEASKEQEQCFSSHRSIVEKITPYGEEVSFKANVGDNEAEREVQEQRMVEEMRVVEEKLLSAAKEGWWDYATAVECSSVHNLPSDVEVCTLSDLVTHFLTPKELQHIEWALGRLHVTRRFYNVVLEDENVLREKRLNSYLRPADVLIFFPDESVLMVSDKEAEGILRAVLKASSAGSTAKIKIRNLAHLTPRLEVADDPVTRMMTGGLSRHLEEGVIVAEFFNGHCNFASRGRTPSMRYEDVLRKVFRPKHHLAKAIASHLSSRRTQNTYLNSHLHQTIKRLEVEAILGSQSTDNNTA